MECGVRDLSRITKRHHHVGGLLCPHVLALLRPRWVDNTRASFALQLPEATMLVTLEAQRGRREQRQQRSESEQQSPQLSTPPSSSPPPIAGHTTAHTKRPIVSLTSNVITTSAATSDASSSSSDGATTTAPYATSALPSSPTAAADSGAGEDELSSRLNGLALVGPAREVRLTPLQALAARPRGSPAPSSTRPATDTAAARRLVMGALGLRNERSEEEKEKERQARREHQRMKREQLVAQKKRVEDEQPSAN